MFTRNHLGFWTVVFFLAFTLGCDEDGQEADATGINVAQDCRNDSRGCTLPFECLQADDGDYRCQRQDFGDATSDDRDRPNADLDECERDRDCPDDLVCELIDDINQCVALSDTIDEPVGTAPGGVCETDGECRRGTVCENQVCEAIPCTGLPSCPGSGRTCLPTLRTCGLKECGEVELNCPQPQICLDMGPFAFNCVDPDMLDADGHLATSDRGDSVVAAEPDLTLLCAACSDSDQCAGLGEGANCTAIGAGGTFCTSACTPNQEGQCPAEYTCLQNVNQCVPQGFNCGGCLSNPCPAGQVCDPHSTMCIPPQDICQSCYGNEYCANGRICSTFMNRDVCLDPCSADGGCRDGFQCTEGMCVPTSGVCDACGGNCGGETPICVAATAQCGECDAQNPCTGGLGCDLMTNTCVERSDCGACEFDAQCQSCAGSPICYMDRCVECLDSTDCAPRFECNQQTFTCEYSPCAGVLCHADANGVVGVCDPADGRCENPADGTASCTEAADCADPETMECNTDTGQCYSKAAECDPTPGGAVVCAPGSECTTALPADAYAVFAGFGGGMADPACTCTPGDLSSDPADQSGGSGCHPGQTCFSIDQVFQLLGGASGGGMGGGFPVPGFGGGGMMSTSENAQIGRCCGSSNPLDCLSL